MPYREKLASEMAMTKWSSRGCEVKAVNVDSKRDARGKAADLRQI